METFEALAKKLGLSVEHLWPLAVRYIVYDAALGALLCSMIVAAGAVLFRNGYKRAREDGTDGELIGGLFVAVAFGMMLVGTIQLFGNVSTLLNPEGALVVQTLKALGGK